MKRRSGGVGAGSGWCSRRGGGSTIRFWYVGVERAGGGGPDTARGGLVGSPGGRARRGGGWPRADRPARPRRGRGGGAGQPHSRGRGPEPERVEAHREPE